MSVVLETFDMETAYDALSDHYNVRRLRVPDAQISLAIRQDQIGPVGIHRVTLDMECRLDAVPLGPLLLVHLARGNMTYHRRGETTAYGPHDLFLSTQPDVPIEVDVRCAEFEFAVLDPGILSHVADNATGPPHGPIRLTGYEPVTPRHAARWVVTYQYVRDTFTAPLAGDEPLLVGAAGRLLAAAALSTFPSTAANEDVRSDRRDAHTETLRRAIAFIDENAHRDISIADIAIGSYASIRSVQLAFRRHLDTTPLRYLRQVRLDSAHRQLVAATPGEESVAAIAHRWGFSNLSRFARSYRATYGVLPSHTLHRR